MFCGSKCARRLGGNPAACNSASHPNASPAPRLGRAGPGPSVRHLPLDPEELLERVVGLVVQVAATELNLDIAKDPSDPSEDADMVLDRPRSKFPSPSA